MRVRPFFWLLLACVYISILAFAATVQVLVPARLHVQLLQRPLPEAPTTLMVHVTDTQGLTVDGAQVCFPTANCANKSTFHGSTAPPNASSSFSGAL